MVQDLGLSHEPSPFHLPSPSERARRRLVFWSVFFLDRVISYGTGRSVTIPETEIDVRGPTEGDCSFFLPTPPLGAGERPPHPWPALIEVARCRGKISDLLNKPGGEGGWGLDRRGEMERLQDEMIGFYQSFVPISSSSPSLFSLSADSLLWYGVLQDVQELALFGPELQDVQGDRVESALSVFAHALPLGRASLEFLPAYRLFLSSD